MNKQRRKAIYNVANRIEFAMTQANIKDIIVDAISDLEVLCDEEMEYMDNIPENLQMSRRYEAAEDACSNLDTAMDLLRDINYDDKENIEEQIKNAITFLSDAAM